MEISNKLKSLEMNNKPNKFKQIIYFNSDGEL